jgi:hypothetical protein
VRDNLVRATDEMGAWNGKTLEFDFLDPDWR